MLFHVSEGSNGSCGAEGSETYYLCHATKEGYNGPTGNGTPDGAFSVSGPTAITGTATGITKTEATLNGTVNPNGVETKYYFEYGETEAYGKKTAEASAGSGTGNVEVSKTITGLTAGTKYNFRIVATNSSKETSEGSNQTFTTTNKPSVETKTATSVGETDATLNGIVNPHGEETKYDFEYGETTSYGLRTAEVSVGSGTSNLEESKAITGLLPGLTYHYRIVASNNSGTAYGADDTLTTTGTPAWFLQTTPNPPEPKEGAPLWAVSCTSGIACTAAGDYRNSEGTSMTLVERWNGVEWVIQSTPNPTGKTGLGYGSSFEGASCASATFCVAVGRYTNAEGTTLTLAEVWNGKEWSVQTTPNPSGASSSYFYAVSCTSTETCTAVGAYRNSSLDALTLAERWNGKEWSIEKSVNPSSVNNHFEGVSCSSSTACTAVGGYENTSGHDVTLAEGWNGTEWSTQTTPNPTEASGSWLSGVSCTSSSACTAVSEYQKSSGELFPLAERWNGTEWVIQSTLIPTGGKDATLLGGVSCASAEACVAVGSYSPSSGPSQAPLAERWNGKEWSIQSTPSPEKYSNLWGGVSCTPSTVICVAAGQQTSGTLAEIYG